MVNSRKELGKRAFQKGIRELVRHRPDLALRYLRSAVEACPVSESAMLESCLYWLGVALLRLDRPELALKSLGQARKLNRGGVAARAYAQRVNGYGMPKRTSPDLDDFYAFFSIQSCLFLSSRPGQRFVSEGEKDTVTRLIAMAWQSVKRSIPLSERSIKEKLRLFRDWPRVFPSFFSPTDGHKAALGGLQDCECSILEVDFSLGQRRKNLPGQN